MEIIAHRGASAEAPENTLAAFDRAVAQRADTLELDLRATADGRLVVLHDPTLLRTHGDPRPVTAVRADEIPGLLPLEAVLERYAGRVRLLLEVKPGVLVGGLAGLAPPDTTIQSFDPAVLRRVRRLAPRLPRAGLHAERPGDGELDVARARGEEGVGVPAAVVDAALVEAAHRRGLRLRAFTVNEPGTVRHLAALGLDGLITDVPGRARAALVPQPVP